MTSQSNASSTQENKDSQSEPATKRIAWYVFFTAIVFGLGWALTANAAGAGGTEFQPLWNALSPWIAGTPGRLAALGAFAVAMFNVARQNWGMAAGSFIGAVVMANAVTIISSLMGAGIASTL